MPTYRTAADSIPIINESHQATLFQLFPGWVVSERVRDTSSWVWQFGFDIQRNKERRWVCKCCVIAGSSIPKNFQPAGLQNAAGHLYAKHILAPPDKPMSREERRATKAPKQLNSIAHYIGLDAKQPVEQSVINKLIQSFD